MTPLTARLTSASVNLAFDTIVTHFLKFVGLPSHYQENWFAARHQT